MVRIDADTTNSRSVRLRVRGQLDLEATGALGQALARAGMLRRPVALDLGEVDFIDGSGLSLVMDAYSRALCTGCELTIVGASRCVRRLVAITGAADRLPPLREGATSAGALSRGEIVLEERRRVDGSAFMA